MLYAVQLTNLLYISTQQHYYYVIQFLCIMYIIQLRSLQKYVNFFTIYGKNYFYITYTFISYVYCLKTHNWGLVTGLLNNHSISTTWLLQLLIHNISTTWCYIKIMSLKCVLIQILLTIIFIHFSYILE